jgi:hypothetical protein
MLQEDSRAVLKRILIEIIIHNSHGFGRTSETARLDTALGALLFPAYGNEQKKRRGPKSSLFDEQVLPLIAEAVAADPSHQRSSFAEKCRAAAKEIDPAMDHTLFELLVRRVRPKFEANKRALLKNTKQPVDQRRQANVDKNIKLILKALAELGILRYPPKRKHGAYIENGRL